eukprot:CAMPEP_0173102156 /NCGR_PEP_ID=MMETSP1102-20130122/37368_1 /TAXON_ID=49646 /ORGANISM="Geminigera sp., Strain Caron Lab Isolate" /LENGTH=82 /DNA_ID=CAMNT_0013996209 /DNA_START=391 /DNA_END=636 /DNA_ORIENTATION=-
MAVRIQCLFRCNTARNLLLQRQHDYHQAILAKNERAKLMRELDQERQKARAKDQRARAKDEDAREQDETMQESANCFEKERG